MGCKVVQLAAGAKREPLVHSVGAEISFPDRSRLHLPEVTICSGDVVALIGSNGSGKTTLCRALMGELPVRAGELNIRGRRPVTIAVPDFPAFAAFIPQNAYEYFAFSTVGKEIAHANALARHQATDEAAFGILEFVDDAPSPDAKPWDLDFIQAWQLAVALAIVSCPAILMLDEVPSVESEKSAVFLRQCHARVCAYGGAILLTSHRQSIIVFE